MTGIYHNNDRTHIRSDWGRGEHEDNDLLIAVKNLKHRYHGGVEALRGVTLDINRGEFVAIIGANGSGKTTLVKHFNGLLKPSEGHVVVQGLNTRNVDVSRLASRVGYVFQNPDHQIFAYSVWEETLFGLNQLGFTQEKASHQAEHALRMVGLYELRERHPRELSRGQRQRLATASVLAVETDILVLDEPTTGQDFLSRRQIMDLMVDLHRKGRTILVVTHDMSLVAEYAERVIVMREGKVVMDASPIDVFAEEETLASTGLRPPPVVEIRQGLKKLGITANALTLEDLVEELAVVLKVEKPARPPITGSTFRQSSKG